MGPALRPASGKAAQGALLQGYRVKRDMAHRAGRPRGTVTGGSNMAGDATEGITLTAGRSAMGQVLVKALADAVDVRLDQLCGQVGIAVSASGDDVPVFVIGALLAG